MDGLPDLRTMRINIPPADADATHALEAEYQRQLFRRQNQVLGSREEPDRRTASEPASESVAKAVAKPVDDKSRTSTTRGNTKLDFDDGCITRLTNERGSISVIYAHDRNNKLLLENGEPVVSRVSGVVNGKPIDLAGASFKINVVQSDKNAGDIQVLHPDGVHKEILRASDLAKLTYERPAGIGNGADWRIRSIVKNDGQFGWESGSYRTFDYDDTANSAAPARIVTSSRTVNGPLVETMQLKSGNLTEYRTFTNDSNEKDFRERKIANFNSTTGEFSYAESKFRWYETPRSSIASDNGVAAARKELLHILNEHRLITNRTNEYLDKFEGKSIGWVQRYREKGWEAPSNKRIANTYRHLADLFDGHLIVSNAERDTYVAEQIAQLGEPAKNFQQRDVGTCAVVGELSAVLRVAADELVGHCVEAMKRGRITSTGVDRQGRHQQFEVDPRPYPDNRRYIDQLQQNMMTAMLGIKHTTERYGGTYANETSYMYNFMTGRHDSFTARRGTSAEDVLNQLRHGNARLSCLGDSHIKDIEDARILRDGTVEFFVHNWWSWQNNGTYGPGTGWYTPESIGIRPLTDITPYLKDLGRK